MTRRVFFYVQHLLGIGHLRRATTLARALDDWDEVKSLRCELQNH